MTISTQPEISVLMSVFNGERYIARALISILVQTFENFEVILIDDGSTDRTAKIVSNIKDRRIKFFMQENMGLTKTINKSLKIAKGKWIARHDADDFSVRSRFADQISYLKKHPTIGLLGSSCFIQPEKRGIINEVYHYPVEYKSILSAFSLINPFVHGSMMIKKQLLLAHGGYNEDYRYVQDYELWSRLIRNTEAHNLETPLYVRSVHQNASQITVDKELIAKTIQENYLKTAGMDTKKYENTVQEIQRTNHYPMLPICKNWNYLLSDSFYHMSSKARKLGLPWMSMRFQAMLYWPWHFMGGRENEKN